MTVHADIDMLGWATVVKMPIHDTKAMIASRHFGLVVVFKLGVMLKIAPPSTTVIELAFARGLGRAAYNFKKPP